MLNTLTRRLLLLALCLMASTVEVNASCGALDRYSSAVSTCNSPDIAECPSAAQCTTCACMRGVMACIEKVASENAVLRSACPAAEQVYTGVVAVVSGVDYRDTTLGPSCHSFACKQSLNCTCDSLASQLDTPNPVVSTASPTGDATPSPPTPTVPAPTTNSTPGNETDNVIVISVTLSATLDDFNVHDFVGKVSEAMSIKPEQVVVISVRSGSVIVQFYFAETRDSKPASELTDIFTSQIVNGTNVLTAAYTIVSVSLELQDVSTATPLPPAPPTTPEPSTSAPSPSSAPPASSGDATGSLSLLTAVIILICCGMFVILVGAAVGWWFYSRWKNRNQKHSPHDEPEEMGNADVPDHYKMEKRDSSKSSAV